jgi:hypothetical protein
MCEGLQTKSVYEAHAGQQIEVFEQSCDQHGIAKSVSIFLASTAFFSEGRKVWKQICDSVLG